MRTKVLRREERIMEQAAQPIPSAPGDKSINGA